MQRGILRPALAAALFGLACALPATAQIDVHVTDGVFTSPLEWDTGRNTVTKAFFPQSSDGRGGAYLYVEQGPIVINPAAGGSSPDTLYLMYDYVDSSNSNSFFDVFFQVNDPKSPNDYLVRMLPGGTNNFQAYEHDPNTTIPIAADGTFDVSPSSGWTPLTSEDLALAKFQTAIGFGPSPDDSTGHVMAEFQLSINNQSPGRTGDPGLYSPEPAFWSASADPAGGQDPPISSAIFTLNPNGTTIVTPVIVNGGPVKLPPGTQATPEPSGLALLFGSGIAGSLFLRRRRRS